MTKEEVREARRKLGLTQDELATRLGFSNRWSKDTVRAWEKGRTPVQGPAALAIRLILRLDEQAKSNGAGAALAPSFARVLLEGLWTGA